MAFGGYSVGVLPSAPGVFTVDGSGAGQAVAWNQDGSPNWSANPAAAGSVLRLSVTGLGVQEGSQVSVTLNGALAGICR